MSDTATDTLHDALDAFLGTVFWSDDEVTLEDALAEAIDDWVALVSAEFNGSRPFVDVVSNDALRSGLLQMAAAVGMLSDQLQPGMTMTLALSSATTDWLESN
ncbi:MAG: hypothetical protein ABJH68_07780 [Ilumatobacter sp.]|uniref:hypothetical protein n=1 Tax=Ilumatobacter sp. TaxID=1967498 RepID=UPI00329A3985